MVIIVFFLLFLLDETNKKGTDGAPFIG